MEDISVRAPPKGIRYFQSNDCTESCILSYRSPIALAFISQRVYRVSYILITRLPTACDSVVRCKRDVRDNWISYNTRVTSQQIAKESITSFFLFRGDRDCPFFHSSPGQAIITLAKPIIFEWDNNTEKRARDSRKQQAVLPNLSNTLLHASKMIALADCIKYELYNLPRILNSTPFHSTRDDRINYLFSQREMTDWLVVSSSIDRMSTVIFSWNGTG